MSDSDWVIIGEDKPKTEEPPTDWLASMIKPIGDYYYDSDMTDRDYDEYLTVCDPSHLTEGRFSLLKGITPISSPEKSRNAMPLPAPPPPPPPIDIDVDDDDDYYDDEEFPYSAGEREIEKMNYSIFLAFENLSKLGLEYMRDAMYSTSGSILRMLKVRSPHEEKQYSVKRRGHYMREKQQDVVECRNQQVSTDLDECAINRAIEELYDKEYDRQYFKSYNTDRFYVAVACSMKFVFTKVVENDKIIFDLRHGREDYHHVLLYLTKQSDTVALWYSRNWYALKFIVNGEGMRKCMKAFVFNDIKVGSIVSTLSGDGNILKIRIAGLQRYTIQHFRTSDVGEYEIFSTPKEGPVRLIGIINAKTVGINTVYTYVLFEFIRPASSVFLILSSVALLDRLIDDPNSNFSKANHGLS